METETWRKSGRACRKWAWRAGNRSERRSSRFVHKVGEIYQAIESRQDYSRRREPRINSRVPNVVRIVSEFRKVVALNPAESVRDLEAAFVYGVERAEVVAE